MNLKERYQNYTDEELMEYLRRGETDVIEYLLDKYKPLVKKQARTMYLIGGENDDLIQEGVIGLYLLLAAAGIICTKVLGMEYPQSNVHRGCMVGGNYAFVVIPLIYALFDGTYGTQYIPICSTVDTVVVWTLGLTLFTWKKGKRGAASLKKLWNPIIGSVIVGLCINSFSIPVPEMVMSTVSQVGETSASWGLIYMGCSLCLIEKAGFENLKRILVLAAVKLLAVPLLIYWMASCFLPETESIILMLIAAAPSMTTSVMIAKQYDLDADYAAEAVSLTTIGCMVTVPLLFFGIGFM